MIDFDHILVKGCPLCDIFLNPKDLIQTKLYTPNIDKVSTTDFIILECKSCKTPMIVVRDHVTDITSEQWGKILYKCRSLFGENVELRTTPRTYKDHWHAHVINMD